MSWGLMHWGMLTGLAGASIPVLIHLLNRRRSTTVDWGAMQFLELGRRARLRFQFSEWLLLAGRMVLLAMVAIALARPFWLASQPPARAASGSAGFMDGPRRDVVLIVDASSSMGRNDGQTRPIDRAVSWAREFVSKLRPGDSVAVLLARDRVEPLITPASFDMKKALAALAEPPRARGTSDLPMALTDALRLLAPPGNPARDVIILTDGQRHAWRPDEPARWAVPRELHRDISRRSGLTPGIWALRFGTDALTAGSNASVAPLELTGGLITAGRQITITTSVACDGPTSLTRTAELEIDGQVVPRMAQVVGPIPSGAKLPISFRTTIDQPGSHALTVRLTGEDDALGDDDLSSRAVDVAAALPVLLVDGEPGVQPLSSETDFLRAALAPRGADTMPVQARVVTAPALAADDLKGQRAVVLANVERLTPPQITALTNFLSAGGGLLIAVGDRFDASFANADLYADGAGWLPARIGATRGDASRRATIAHPAPRTFVGPALARLGQGDKPPLAGADLFEFRALEPRTDASVIARLDTGDPWIVERSFGRGRVALLAGPIDAEGGTLPVNPDFVPWAHELIYHLSSASDGHQSVRPGEPIVIELISAPPAGATSVRVTTPGGETTQAAIVRSEGRAQARLDDPGEAGIYRFHVPGPPEGIAFATVAADSRESDLRPLEPAEAARLACDFPLTLESDQGTLVGRVLARGPAGRHEIWRYLVVGTLAGLCMEVWLTRRMVMKSGMADALTSIDTTDRDRGHAT